MVRGPGRVWAGAGAGRLAKLGVATGSTFGGGVGTWTITSGEADRGADAEAAGTEAAAAAVETGGRDAFLSMRSRLANVLAACCGPNWNPFFISFGSFESDDFHRLQPSKSISAYVSNDVSATLFDSKAQCLTCIHPHSTIFLSSHFNETGLVRKSLHPAARAFTRSLCRDEAVRATMMTDDLNGDGGTGAFSAAAEEDRGCSVAGVEGKTPMLLFLSSLRISFVASIPSITGS